MRLLGKEGEKMVREEFWGRGGKGSFKGDEGIFEEVGEKLDKKGG